MSKASLGGSRAGVITRYLTLTEPKTQAQRLSVILTHTDIGATILIQMYLEIVYPKKLKK